MNSRPLSRRHFLQTSTTLAALPWVGSNLALAADAIPQSVQELWADFDPRKDALETEIIREWKEDGGVFRHVRFLVGNFKGKPARLTAIYGFPDGAKERLPAVMHIHGGGQRAFLGEVKFLVGRGYAALSVNWGGSGTGKPPFNSPEGAQPGDPNTDWGAIDPSQLNVQGYHTVLPGPGQFFEDREHPKNNNWYLLTLACRRGLTFLEQQPEVDPLRLGVHGFSMGGNLTHQQSWTRKFTDPMYRGADGAKLKLSLIMPSTNRLTFVMNENEWRSYRGRRKTFVCERAIQGGDAVQTVIIEARDFTADGDPLKSWAQIDQFGICPYNPERRDPAKPPPPWNGAAAKFVRLEWE